MKVWFDDIRTPEPLPDPDYRSACMPERLSDWRDWVVVRLVSDAIDLLKTGLVTEISLDHDIGPEEKFGTGYDVVAWVERHSAENPSWRVPEIYIHTANPAAASRMYSAVKAIEARINKETRRGTTSH